jgi:hypothetical protein
MPRKQKVLIDFSRYSDSDLISFSESIQAAMPASGFYPTPSPALTVIDTATADFRAAMNAAAIGGSAQTDFKNEKRAVLTELLQEEGAYVQLVSEGDPGKIKAGGWEASKIPSPIGPLPQPQKFMVVPGQKGQLKMSLERIYGAGSYQFEYKLKDAAVWIVASSRKTKITINGLESGKEYAGRVVPIGTSEERTYSIEISCFVN